jgi:hypothetical protein
MADLSRDEPPAASPAELEPPSGRELEMPPPPSVASSDAEDADARVSGEGLTGEQADTRRSGEPCSAAPIELLGGCRPTGAPHGAGSDMDGGAGVEPANEEYW